MTIDTRSVSSATPAMREAAIAGAATPVVVDYVRARGPEGIKFDVWYCNEHLPGLAREYPLRRLRRYAAPSRGAYLALGEIDALPAPGAGVQDKSPLPPMVEHHERFIGEPLNTLRRRDVGDNGVDDAAIVYPALLRVPDARLAELGRWYDEEHLPILLSSPQWLLVRRFRVRDAQGTDFRHVALHYLADARALQSPERDAARNTPWRDKLVAEDWFAPEYRVCYRLQDF